MELDLRISADVIHTMDPGRPTAHTVGIWHNRIVGVDEQIEGLSARREITHSGAILPGFIDAHTHLQLTGQTLNALDISGIDSVDEVIKLIADYAAGLSTGAWVEISGYDQRAFGRDLTADDLDAAVGERKAWARHTSSHSSVISSAVIRDIEDPDLRQHAVDARGVLHEEEQVVVQQQRLPYPIGEVKGAVAAAAGLAAQDGVTMSIEAGAGGSIGSLNPLDLIGFQELIDEGRMPMRIQMMPSHDALHAVTGGIGAFSRGLDLGLRTGIGSDMLSIGPMKFVLDGGMAVRTALLTEPYIGTDSCGVLREDLNVFRRNMIDAVAGGWTLAVHAIGDAALDIALDIFDESFRLTPDHVGGHRIEHGGLIRDDQIPRLAALGLTVVGQSGFLWVSGDDYAEQLGQDRVSGLYRGQSLVDAGVPLVGSTDRPLPGSPLQGIRTSVDRLTDQGTLLAPVERISVYDAVAGWTTAAAAAAGMGDRLGAIREGYLADLVLLSADPHTVPVSEITDISIVDTMVDGQLISDADGHEDRS